MTTTSSLPQRSLGGRSGASVSALGLGCWAIGGPWSFDGRPAGWGDVDDAESIRAIRRALDLGVTLFDTADVYGCGHSERVLGRALAGRRDEALIATKFGLRFDEATRTGGGEDTSPGHIRRACEGSLLRLATDRIDLLQLHAATGDPDAVVATLESLVAEGKIRFYGTSNDAPEVIEAFAAGPHCASVQQQLNVFGGNDALAACERTASPRSRGRRSPWACSRASTVPAEPGRRRTTFAATPPTGTTSTTTPFLRGTHASRRSARR